MKKCFIIYGGWPKLAGLLEDFFEKLEIIFFMKHWCGAIPSINDVVGIAYSAGALDLLEDVKKNPGKFSRLIFIAPAGASIFPNHPFFNLWGFSMEVLKLLRKGEFRIFWEILKEVFFKILFFPIKSFREIEKIRKFDLWQEFSSIKNLPPCFFVFPVKDEFIRACRGKSREFGTYFTDIVSSGHFGLVEAVGYYQILINRIIQQPVRPMIKI